MNPTDLDIIQETGGFEWLDNLAEGIVLIGQNRIIHMNKVAACLLDINPIRSRHLPVITAVRDHRIERAYLEQCDVEVITRGHHLMISGMPEGLILRDVSLERNAQENARELLAVLSHELRTPVTVIQSTLEALHYNLSSEQRQSLMVRAESETARLIRLLEDLTVDVKPPSARRVSLLECLSRAEKLLTDTFQERHVKLDYSNDDIILWVDADKLLQILVNLLENAALHGNSHSCVRLLSHIDEDMAYIRVQDEGMPLNADVIEKLFRPNSRGQGAKAKGTGLGLYIVKSIVERWGGVVWSLGLEHGNEFGFSAPLPQHA